MLARLLRRIYFFQLLLGGSLGIYVADRLDQSGAAALALVFPATAYEAFLLFIGSVFCPLFGVVLADYFFLRRKNHPERPFHRQEFYWYSAGFNPWAFVSWGAGFGLYHLMQKMTAFGSSIPSLVVAGAIYLFLMGVWKPAAEAGTAPVAR